MSVMNNECGKYCSKAFRIKIFHAPRWVKLFVLGNTKLNVA